MGVLDTGEFERADLSFAAEVVAATIGVFEEPRWCNFEFVEPEDFESNESSLFGMIAARGPANPMATITGPVMGQKPVPIQLGVLHRAGVKAATQLAEAGVGVPDTWLVVQDHPRRGLVAGVPTPSEPEPIAEWMIKALEALSRTPITTQISYQLSS